MTPDQILVTLGGLAVIGGIIWFFWLKRSPGVKASVVSDGYQEQMVLVKGGYTPDVIVVEAGKPVRLTFVRQESASCTEMVLLPDFGKSATLPEGEPVAVEFLPKTGAENDPWSTFTSREQRILMLMTCGRTNREIASVIAVHESVVAATIQQLMHRTGAVNRPSLIAYYLYHKLFRNEALPAMDAAYQN